MDKLDRITSVFIFEVIVRTGRNMSWTRQCSYYSSITNNDMNYSFSASSSPFLDWLTVATIEGDDHLFISDTGTCFIPSRVQISTSPSGT